MTHILKCILCAFMCCTRIGNGPVVSGLTVTLPSGPNSYPTNAIIEYNRILCSSTNYAGGKYKATMAGNYLVSVTMMSGTVTAHTTLRKNGGIYVWLYTGNQFDMATQTVCMQLEVNDEIWVQMTNKASILFDVYNTFTVVKLPDPERIPLDA
ncbi:uncharacterized protein LOC134708608 [Mytilus trossulus]|uniref:uncharacterized protein LOC134708608 n=1 Tax=Mytilus trossulus TaxID=6551 RepID=UPI0030055B70